MGVKMKLHKAKKICFAIHYGIGKRLNWKKRTVDKMEKHRHRYNTRFNRKDSGFRLIKRNSEDG